MAENSATETRQGSAASLQVRRGSADDSCQAGNLSFSGVAGGGGGGGIFPLCYPAMYLFNRDSVGLFLLIKKMPAVGFDPWSAVPGFMRFCSGFC